MKTKNTHYGKKGQLKSVYDYKFTNDGYLLESRFARGNKPVLVKKFDYEL